MQLQSESWAWDWAGEGVSTYVCRCLARGVQAGQLEARAVPGAAPALGRAPGCGGAWPGHPRSACRSPRTGQTAGPGSGSAPAPQGPGWGPSPLPSSRPHTHTSQPAGDSSGAPWLGGTGQRLWFQLLVPPEHAEDGALEGQGGRVAAPALLLGSGPEGTPPSSRSPHSRLLSPSPLSPAEAASPLLGQFLEHLL